MAKTLVGKTVNYLGGQETLEGTVVRVDRQGRYFIVEPSSREEVVLSEMRDVKPVELITSAQSPERINVSAANIERANRMVIVFEQD